MMAQTDITMNVALFLRVLEFAREDAQSDVELHIVAERANLLTQAKGRLTMKDYEQVAGCIAEMR
jgi:hypothetical protein